MEAEHHSSRVCNSSAVEMEIISRQIEWHYAQISLLKNKRNLLAPISNLPNEILCQIFSVYATESGDVSSLKWTKLMLICRRWYDLAINHQHLWSFIEVHGFHTDRDTKRLEVQLKRSGAAPLTIKLVYHTSPAFSSMVLDHSSRIVCFDVTGHAAVVLAILPVLPSHQFPVLQTLKLKPDEIPDGTHSNFPDEIFDVAPRLKSLALSFVDLRLGLLRGLDSLALTRCAEATTSIEPSFSDLLSTLGSLPGLKSLHLENLISELSPGFIYNPVALPRLEFLYLRDDLQYITDLLTHLIIPPTTSLALYPSGLTTGREARRILVLLRRHLRSPSATTPRVIQIDCPQVDSNTAYIPNLMINTYVLPQPPNLFGDAASFRINSHPVNEHALRQIMTKVMNTIHCDSITHLDARAATHLTMSSWRTALALLPSLETVYLFLNNAATNLVCALLEMEDAPKYPRRRLRHIQLLVFDWHREDEPDRVARDALERLLRAWHRAGAPLETLEIDERFGPRDSDEDQWALFSGLVGTLVRNRDRV
ncbi:hypothetical protein B0H15DRAFT_836947 [Mycena belliarum]|uniref:F-box domain-containing protein n=1 Tax=Mycena belliarum TaxID=1033014 RepID=A0AAD6U660_9AGAR|nr:hypothetical protein B0H15DRAFT_836947 [Mycena belliae]